MILNKGIGLHKNGDSLSQSESQDTYSTIYSGELNGETNIVYRIPPSLKSRGENVLVMDPSDPGYGFDIDDMHLAMMSSDDVHPHVLSDSIYNHSSTLKSDYDRTEKNLYISLSKSL